MRKNAEAFVKKRELKDIQKQVLPLAQPQATNSMATTCLMDKLANVEGFAKLRQKLESACKKERDPTQRAAD